MHNSIVDNLQKNRENTIYFRKDKWLEDIKGSSNYSVKANDMRSSVFQKMTNLQFLRVNKFGQARTPIEETDDWLFEKAFEASFSNSQFIRALSYELHRMALPIEAFIDSNMFDNFTKLLDLELYVSLSNNIGPFPEFLFKNLKNLKKLSLMSGLYLNNNHFHGLPNLESLRYHGDFHGEIDNLSNLKELQHSHGHRFDEFDYKGFEKLEILYLYDAKFTPKTRKKLFQNLKNLRNFYIDSFYVEDLDKLVINKEILQNITANIELFKCDDYVLNCLNESSIPFIYRLKNLYIKFDGDIEIDIDKFNSFLYRNDNIFVNLESVTLCFHRTNAISICIDCFKRMKKLKNLKLKKAILCGIDKEFDYLEEASFDSRIPDNISNFINLTKLELEWHTEIIQLSENFLEDLINLEYLRLAKVFDSIDLNAQYLFKNLIKLKNLELFKNSLNHLKSTYFEFLVNLEELDLKDNSIQAVDPGSFKRLSKLKRLDLTFNPINEINKSTLDGLSDFVLKINNLK